MLSLSRARVRAFAFLLSVVSAFAIVATATPANAYYNWRSAVPTEAAKYRGAPYQWGAAGPSRFDCSGYTQYVYGKFGKRLPRTSTQQYTAMHKVAKNQKVKGDLLFFRNSSGRISHVAIYAGGTQMWHSPRAGYTVRLINIYSSNYSVGRL